MKQRIRLTESDLHRIVKESVNKVVRESTDGNLYAQIQTIDKSLSQIDDDSHVSRFYSDENQITIAVSRSVNHLGKRKIIEMMKNYGYDYSTSGANDEYIMMTFERICRTESKGKKGKVLKEGFEKKGWDGQKDTPWHPGRGERPYGFQDDGHGSRIHVNHKGAVDGWDNGKHAWGRIENPADERRRKRDTDGWKDQYATDKSYIQSRGFGKNKQWRTVSRSIKESMNNLADNPQYERFVESLYDLVGQYYWELGEETIVDNLKHVAQWVEEGGLDK